MGTILYHGVPNGASFTVLAAMEECGLDIACRSIDLLAGERHTIAGLTDHRALDMSVEGEGPVLVIDGEAMTESVFIAQYFDEAAGGAGLQPADPHAHWQMLMLCRRLTERVSPAAAYLGCKAHSYAPLAAMSDSTFAALTSRIGSVDLKLRWVALRAGEFSDEQLADCIRHVTASVESAESDLQGKEWLLGHFSIADLVAYGWLAGMVALLPDLFAEKPRVQAWLARVKARPAVAKALARATIPDPSTSWAPGPEINRWG